MRATAWFVLAFAPCILFAQRKPFDADAMLHIQRISDPQLSPDGRTVAFAVSTPDIAANKNAHSIWSVPLDGGLPRKLVDAAERPRWSSDGKRIFYAAEVNGVSQILSMNPDGSGVSQVTRLASGARNEIVSPDGKSLVFTSDVFPDCGADDACNAKHVAEASQDKVKARLITGLLYRHWTSWEGKTRSHLLAFALDTGKVADLTPGDRDAPPFSLGGPDDFAISPDGKEVCYSMNSDPIPAAGTNNDLYVVAITGGESRKITGNPGADNSPQYSPDGKYIAYRSQQRAGYESDRWRLMVLERATGAVTTPTEAVDRSIESFAWSPDSQLLFFTVMDRGREAIQFVGATGGPTRVAVQGNNTLGDMQFTRDGKTIIFSRESGDDPAEICKATSTGGAAIALTHLNDSLLSQYQLNPFEDFWSTGADGAQIQSFLLKPPGFNSASKYPALMLIHGGPQSEWSESWSYRWNAQVFAAAGFVVVMPNPHGSVGYGQQFTDSINGDWGGKPYDDIMDVTDYVAKLPYVDAGRIAAAGASYGGYMIDWILGHTKRFRCLVSHAGVYDLKSEAESTEELWFPIWEFGGMPWQNPEIYAKWSPSNFENDFATPTLVIHGELDFRIPYTQGLQLYTVLQMRKIPSQLLIFPDEGHWILKPGNSLLWYKTVLDWLANWTKK